MNYDNVAWTFGRLGQSSDTTIANGSPFVWVTATGTNEAPGFQVSLFPEHTDGSSADWSIAAASNNFKLKAKAKAFASISVPTPPSAPSAAKAPATTGAQALAASVIAAATVAATMF